jgi:hypothetical protein
VKQEQMNHVKQYVHYFGFVVECSEDFIVHYPIVFFELNLQLQGMDGHVEKMEMRNGLYSKHEIIMYKNGIVDHKWVYDQNYVCLLHSYGNLCFCLHKYSFTFSIFYIQLLCHTILLPWISHTHKLCQNFSKLKS